MTIPETIAMIEQSPRNELSPEEVAEAFALNTRATDVQREMLTTELVGHVIDWTIPVYEVQLSDGRFAVTSQPIPISNAEAIPLLRAVAMVLPRSKADDDLLRTLQTDDHIRIRGIVQEIRLRTVVAVTPAVLVSQNQPGASEISHQDTSDAPQSEIDLP